MFKALYICEQSTDMSKTMELNIFTRKAGPKASEDVYKIAFEDYWRVYFRLLATIGQTVNQREEDVLAYILSRPQHENNEKIDYFAAPYANDMRATLNLARSEITRLKQSLRAKRMIDDDNQPVAALLVLREHTLKFKNISFVFPMEIIV